MPKYDKAQAIKEKVQNGLCGHLTLEIKQTRGLANGKEVLKFGGEDSCMGGNFLIDDGKNETTLLVVFLPYEELMLKGGHMIPRCPSPVKCVPGLGSRAGLTEKEIGKLTDNLDQSYYIGGKRVGPFKDKEQISHKDGDSTIMIRYVPAADEGDIDYIKKQLNESSDKGKVIEELFDIHAHTCLAIHIPYTSHGPGPGPM